VQSAPRKMQSQPKREVTFLSTFVMSGMAAITAESCTYPLDVLKTRLQTTKHLSPFQITKTLFLEEGASKLVLGLEAACLRHIFYSGIRVMLYEVLRDNTPLGKSADGSFPIWKSAGCALVSGGLGQFIASPTDFVKVQMQVEGLRVIMGQDRHYRNTYDCARTLLRKYGFFGMWSGCVPNVQRGALIQIGDLCAYDTVKQSILKYTSMEDTWRLHGVSSTIAGLVSTIMCNPCDVVKTRMMNNPTEFKGTMHCFGSIIRNEGFMTLYQGFFPIWARLGPWSVIFFLTYEKLRSLYGIQSF